MEYILVRSGKREDIPSILNLIKELAAYEKEPNAVVISEEVLMNDAFGTDSAFEFIVAELAALAVVEHEELVHMVETVALSDITVARKWT